MLNTATAVALISGGKDSLFTLHIAQALGYKIEILGHIRTKNSKDDRDSYMYQTVGSSCVEAIAECLSLPIKTHILKGYSKQTDSIHYEKIEGDEVEDLYELLTEILKDYPQVKYVITGAILSNYQRCRVENVCQRLNLVSLAFLWKMPQSILLSLMTCSKEYNFILIKTACMGLTQNDLGQSIHDLTPKFLTMEKEFGFNCCGEGGEYETITFNSPLFTKKFIKPYASICDHDGRPCWKTKIVTDNSICSVCYLYLEDSVMLGDKADNTNTCNIIEKIYTERIYENRYYLLDLLGTLDYMKFFCLPENETCFYFKLCETDFLTINKDIFFLSQQEERKLSKNALKKDGKNDNLLSFFSTRVQQEEPFLILKHTNDIIKPNVGPKSISFWRSSFHGIHTVYDSAFIGERTLVTNWINGKVPHTCQVPTCMYSELILALRNLRNLLNDYGFHLKHVRFLDIYSSHLFPLSNPIIFASLLTRIWQINYAFDKGPIVELNKKIDQRLKTIWLNDSFAKNMNLYNIPPTYQKTVLQDIPQFRLTQTCQVMHGSHVMLRAIALKSLT